MITFKSTLLSKEQLTQDVWSFSFSRPSDFDFKAGQYVILHIPQEDGKNARRLYSMLSTPRDKETLHLLVQFVPGGLASKYLTKKNKGEDVTIQGPAGMFTLKKQEKPIIFLATGTGIAPILSMITDITENNPQTSELILLWGLKTFKDTYLREELEALSQQNKQFSYKLCLSREIDIASIPQMYADHCIAGRITAPLDNYTPFKGDTNFYICGSRDIVDSLRQHLTDKGVEKTRIHSEKF